jgi:glycosyltransferase involved in cell wall biosynthesis
LRVGIYDLYWSTLGGGEQVDGTIAQTLAADHDVTLLGPSPVDVARTRDRLGIDLAGCGYRRVVTEDDATEASADYDLFVNGTFMSRAVNRAPLGYYYVFFPQAPTTRVDRTRRRLYRVAADLLGAAPALPHALQGVRAGFERRVQRTEFLGSYRRFFADSQFAADWTRRLWGVEAEVLYPPVRPTVSPGDKRRLILGIGRFFDPSVGHSKKQLELVETFGRMHRAGALDGWELALVGGCDPANRDYALAVRRAAVGLPVHVHINAPGELVERLLAEASLYWHSGGFGEDPVRHPDRFEHFGIAVVEAMAAGAVPIVFGAAGPGEIVASGRDGEHWHTLDELAAVTRALVADPARRSALAAAAVARSRDFDVERFRTDLRAIVAADAQLT